MFLHDNGAKCLSSSTSKAPVTSRSRCRKENILSLPLKLPTALRKPRRWSELTSAHYEYGRFFFTPIPWKWTSAGPHCAAVRDIIPQHGSLACYNLPLFTQRGLYQVSAISFIMHIWLIKRPHVALHKNSCSRPLFPCIVSQQSRPVETPNGRDFFFIYLIVAVLRKEFVCEHHASNCRGDIAATS